MHQQVSWPGLCTAVTPKASLLYPQRMSFQPRGTWGFPSSQPQTFAAIKGPLTIEWAIVLPLHSPLLQEALSGPSSQRSPLLFSTFFSDTGHHENLPAFVAPSLYWLRWVFVAHVGISYCAARVPGGTSSPVAVCRPHGLWESFSTRDWTCTPRIGRWILNPWTIRGSPL